jgi:hypothetical protein
VTPCLSSLGRGLRVTKARTPPRSEARPEGNDRVGDMASGVETSRPWPPRAFPIASQLPRLTSPQKPRSTEGCHPGHASGMLTDFGDPCTIAGRLGGPAAAEYPLLSGRLCEPFLSRATARPGTMSTRRLNTASRPHCRGT